jgi:hypothetical protein
MKRTVIFALLFGSTLVLQGCATSEKVQVAQVGDQSLSCHQIKSEFDKLDEAQASIESKKGVNGKNVAAAIAWLPGLAYTYYDAGQATDKISERRTRLTDLFGAKHCDSSILTKKSEASKPVVVTTTSADSQPVSSSDTPKKATTKSSKKKKHQKKIAVQTQSL